MTKIKTMVEAMTSGNLLVLMALAKYDLDNVSASDTKDVMRGMMYDAEYASNAECTEYRNFDDEMVFDKFMYRVEKEVSKREIFV